LYYTASFQKVELPERQKYHSGDLLLLEPPCGIMFGRIWCWGGVGDRPGRRQCQHSVAYL